MCGLSMCLVEVERSPKPVASWCVMRAFSLNILISVTVLCPLCLERRFSQIPLWYTKHGMLLRVCDLLVVERPVLVRG